MQELSGSVGENGANARHDVALVQAILVHTSRPADLHPTQAPYLAATDRAIDGVCGRGTIAALTQFQNEQVFVGPDGRTSQAVDGAAPGLVRPGDPTWRRLVERVARDFSDLRVLAGGSTVYLPAPATQHAGTLAALRQLTFEAAFRQRVERLLQRIHTTHGIAVAVCPSGDRRTFQHQYELLTSVDAQGRPRNVTRAGPGESNHNFGQAVDLGFAGLSWLRGNGTPVTDETPWLHRLDPRQRAAGEALIFWEMLRSEGTAIGLFRGPLADRPHLQAWSDAGVDMAARLADLLTRSGTMRWAGTRQRYQCDLGFGGEMFEVGSAAQVWSRQATVTVAMLTRARAQRAAPLPMPGGRGGGVQAPPRGQALVGTGAITQSEVDAVRRALRGEFEAADANWTQWRPR